MRKISQKPLGGKGPQNFSINENQFELEGNGNNIGFFPNPEKTPKKTTYSYNKMTTT